MDKDTAKEKLLGGMTGEDEGERMRGELYRDFSFSLSTLTFVWLCKLQENPAKIREEFLTGWKERMIGQVRAEFQEQADMIEASKGLEAVFKAVIGDPEEKLAVAEAAIEEVMVEMRQLFIAMEEV